MKVLCSACEAAEARVLCCADEAALCARCDRDVHAANRLAGKHHRLPLLPQAPVSAPTCDICQECHPYFFCVEDRALLCRTCDVAVHTANAFVSGHRRFLLTGVQVGLQSDAQEPEPQPPSAAVEAAAAGGGGGPLQTPASPAKRLDGGSPAPLYSDDGVDWEAGSEVAITGNLPDWSVVDEQFSTPVPVTKNASKRSPAAVAFAGHGGFAGGMPDWPLDEFFGLSEFNTGVGYSENGTSKADSGKQGSTDGSPAGRSSSDSAARAMFGQVPEAHQWSVPELPSPPTASGLHWDAGAGAAAVSVPDISSSENPFRCFAAAAGGQPPKRRRRR